METYIIAAAILAVAACIRRCLREDFCISDSLSDHLDCLLKICLSETNLSDLEGIPQVGAHTASTTLISAHASPNQLIAITGPEKNATTPPRRRTAGSFIL